MHLIVQKVLEYFLRRKLNFLFTVIVIGITVYMLSMTMSMYARVSYDLYETKRIFADDQVINVNILMSEQDSRNYYTDVAQFLEAMKERWGENFGKFIYMTVNYEYAGVKKMENTLYLDKSMFDLCCVNFYNGNGRKWKFEKTNEDILYGFVCHKRIEEYPIGTVIENTNTGSKTKIVGYYDEDQFWAPSLLLHQTEPTIKLDDHIISLMDEEYFSISEDFYGNLFNSVYIKTIHGDVANIKMQIRDLADTFSVKCYINSLEDLIWKERIEKKEMFDSVALLILFSLFLGLSGLLISFVSDVSSWRKEIAIMYVNCVSTTRVFLIIMFENLIKAAVGFGMAVYFYGRDMKGLDGRIFFHMVVPWLFVGTIAVVVLFSFVAFKTVRQKNLMLIIGGENI